MISIKRNISFALEVKPSTSKHPDTRRTASTPSGRVRCVVTWKGQRLRIGLNHVVEEKGWEPLLQRCRAKTFHGKAKTPASLINRDIDELEELINGIFRAFEERDTIPSKDEVMSEYSRLTAPKECLNLEEKPTDIFPVYEAFMRDGVLSGRWTTGTLTKFRTIGKHLKAISPNLTFADLDNDGVNRFIAHAATIPDNLNNDGLSNSTVKKYIEVIKVFLNWAHERGYCEESKFARQRVRLKTTDKPVVYLNWEELMRVYNCDLSNKPGLAQVRDVFCFCCFTSLRYSDVLNLRKDNITDSEIRITTVKTNDTITIDLNKYSASILEKYKDVPLPKNRALPVITNQKMNEHLKTLGQLCQLNSPVTVTVYKGATRIDRIYKKWELLSSHVGRRTFISNALMLGIPPDIVMKWTGHSDYKAMRPYIAIADDAKKRAMHLFDNPHSEEM